MAYWEAVASFLVDQDIDTFEYLIPIAVHDDDLPLMSANPWTGIATILFIYLSKVGSIARQLHHLRKLSSFGAFSGTFEGAKKTLLESARHLEEVVARYVIPAPRQVEDTGDCFTPTGHFETLAKVYQLSILLELYRMFPELVTQQLSGPPSMRPEETGRQEHYLNHLNGLAINILTLLASIPETSGTRAVQMLPLIIAGSTLQNGEAVSNRPGTENQILALFRSRESIQHWRSFTRSRLQDIDRHVGLETVRRASEIIEKTWEIGDKEVLELGRDSKIVSPVQWIDVMTKERLETVLG